MCRVRLHPTHTRAPQDHYRIYNLCSERAYDPAEFCGRAVRFKFDDHNPCLLDLIPAFCEDVDKWLATHDDNVVAIHCKAGKGRTGLMIAAYLVHSGFAPSAMDALQYFGDVRTANGKGVTIPSQMRFVHYYEHMLRHGPSPIYSYRITHIRLCGVPAAKMGGVCDPFFWMMENNIKVFDYVEAIGGKERLRKFRAADKFVDLDLTGYHLVVRENIKVQFFDKSDTGGKSKLFHFWFHTAYIANNYLRLTKSVIDKAVKDKHHRTYPKTFAVEVYLHRVDDAEVMRRRESDFTGTEEVHIGDSDPETDEETKEEEV